MDEKEKLKIKKEFAKGEVYYVIKYCLYSLGGGILGFLVIYFLVKYLDPKSLHLLYPCLVCVPGIGIATGKQAWSKIQIRYSDLQYEEEHGVHRPKSIVDRVMDGRSRW